MLYCHVCNQVIPSGQPFLSVSVYRERFIADDDSFQHESAETVWQAHPDCAPETVIVDLAGCSVR